MTSLEAYACEMLDCGTADLYLLDNIYSTLAEDAYNRKDLLDEIPKPTLNQLLFETYLYVTQEIQKRTIQLLKKDNSLLPKYKAKLLNKANGLTKYEPYTNCIDTHFQNNLDDTVDWDEDVTANATYLINYWQENDKKEAVELWETLDDIPINENEEIDTDWEQFPKGTPREEIWHWFEEEYGISVAEDLMNR